MGLQRTSVLGPASSDTQQINPSEEEEGEKVGGIKAKETQYQVFSSGSRTKPSIGA